MTKGESASTNSSRGSGSIIFLFFIIGLIGSLVVGWIIFPMLLYSEKKQPIDYNHAIHLDAVDNGCESCHFFREDGTFSGIPKLSQCVDCHGEVQGSNPEEKRFVEEYVQKETEVPWLAYSRQPDCVFFSHVVHVKTAEMKCEVCHGPIGSSEHSKEYEQNRITGLSRAIWGPSIAGFRKNSWDSMKMDVCGQCHEKETGSKGPCFQCHK
ncbi:MAG: cytochrome C [Desulfobacterales bacterium]|nr:cytochrome C [Desulfobacterales bacterium]